MILFISSVGLLASKDIIHVIKKYGLKFIFLGFLITSSGMFFTTILKKLFNANKYIFSGIFTGALTSSPGFASALETSKFHETQVGYGYALGYIPGVLVVVLSMYLLPKIFKINIEKELQNLKNDVKETQYNEKNFDFIAFSLIIIIGIIIGKIKFNFGVVKFSFGITGGVLMSSLFFGNLKQFLGMNFNMNTYILKNIKELGLLIFLSSVGLRYGYTSINSLNSKGILYIISAFIIGFLSLLIGFLFGRYVFKMNWIMLSGALCGGMTSTPGLGAAIDSTKSDDVTAGYGATYPFALIGMVIFVILLNN
ncbi:aspartate:alanine antiporter [Tepiditoga spiralis]|uniref:Aspartate:alanine antiporter n=1 Tax=Tepiditoga spiralis TaxID=2108365 RepID=A0A7G1G5H7_9BACT|nr:aspartate:alanine antiporter [Tepiditoga spiralis]